MILPNPVAVPVEDEKWNTSPPSISSDPPPYSPNPSHISFGSSSRSSSSTLQGEDPEKSKKEDYTQPSFSRPPSFITGGSVPPEFSEEMFLLARNSLQKGFPPVAPPYSNEDLPHPFATHDVTEDDWQRFLLDIQQSACLTESQASFVNNIPIISLIPIVNCTVSFTLKHLLQAHRKKAVERTLASWNHTFFRPRGLDVALTQGRWQIGGGRTPSALGLNCYQRKQFQYQAKTEWKQWKVDMKHHKWDGLEAMGNASCRERKQFKRECRAARKEVKREYMQVRKDLRHKHTTEGWVPHDGAYRLWVLPYTAEH